MSTSSSSTVSNGTIPSSSTSTSSSITHRIGFIGAGNMATALIKGLLSKGVLTPSQVSVSSPSGPSSTLVSLGIFCTKINAEVVDRSDILIFAVKPFMMETAILSIEDSLAKRNPKPLFVSIAAGTTIASITQLLGSSTTPRIIRVMPNTPSQVLQGASAMCTNSLVTSDETLVVKTLFEAVGIVETVKETHLDAVTGLSGSGPAYVCMFIEALADGGVASGLPRSVAMSLAMQLVKGAASMVQLTGQHPGALKDAVASPGGTTIAGIHALERGAFRGTVMNAVVAATERSIQLSQPK